MLVQDQALDVGLGLVDLRGQLGEPEARDDVGHEAHAAVVDLLDQLLAVRLVDQAQHRGGMRVVDEVVRQEGVQQRLHRRVGRASKSSRLTRWKLTMSSSDSLSSLRSLRSGSSFTAGRPGGSMTAMSQPEPLTHSTSCVSPEQVGHLGLDARCCRRRAAPASGRRPAGAWCRCAAPAPRSTPFLA